MGQGQARDCYAGKEGARLLKSLIVKAVKSQTFFHSSVDFILREKGVCKAYAKQRECHLTKAGPVGEVFRSQEFSFKCLFIYGFTERNFGPAVFKNIAVMRYLKRELISLPLQPAAGCR